MIVYKVPGRHHTGLGLFLAHIAPARSDFTAQVVSGLSSIPTHWHPVDMLLTVYDKNFQITSKGQTIENETDGTNILRIELSMKRNAYYRALKLKPGKKLSYDVILRKLYKHGSKLIRKQMKNLFPCDGKHLPYQEAKRRIEKEITNKKTQEKMLYLLEKTSRSDTLDHAIKKTQERYRIGEKGMNRYSNSLMRFRSIQLPSGKTRRSRAQNLSGRCYYDVFDGVRLKKWVIEWRVFWGVGVSG